MTKEGGIIWFFPTELNFALSVCAALKHGVTTFNRCYATKIKQQTVQFVSKVRSTGQYCNAVFQHGE